MRFLITKCIIVALFAFSCPIFAQDEPYERCLAQSDLLNFIASDPNLEEKFHKQELELKYFKMTNPNSLNRTRIVIPLVIHIVHRTFDQNISDLQILDQLDILNRAFSMNNSNLFTVPPQFRHLISDVGIEFCLAQEDPLGNPTNGIIRKQTSIENIGTTKINGTELVIHFSAYGGSDSWDPEKYLNIWVTEMDNNIAGSATFPGMAPYPEADGIIINYKYFGSIGSASQSFPYNEGKTLVHEVGHFFNLFHPWGPSSGGCDLDDFVDDTPLQEGPYFDCHPENSFSCGSEDLVVNFMDYTEDQCLAMFTHGQKERMIASIQLFRPGLINNLSVCKSSSNNTTTNPSDFRIVKPEGIQKIYIYSPDEKIANYNLVLYDVIGRMVWQENITHSAFHQVNTSSFPSGIYFVCLNFDDHQHCTKIINF
jgi:hypothetical protein